jgi:hypothetical protein
MPNPEVEGLPLVGCLKLLINVQCPIYHEILRDLEGSGRVVFAC